jgi:hypothetical protein
MKNMKKILIMILAIFSIAYQSRAQDSGSDSREKLQVGFKLGLNYSNVYDEQGDNFTADGKFGFVTGAFLSIPIGKYLGVQPEILFSQKGYQANGSILGISYTYSRTLNYIDVPLLVQLKPSPFVSLVAGPQFSYLIKQQDKFENTIQEQDFNNDNIRKNILGVVGGFDINPNHFVFSARVGWDVTNNNGDGTSTNPRYKNVWYQTTIGFRF